MRVLQFGRFDVRSHKGGVQAHVDDLARALSQHISVDNVVANLRGESRVEQIQPGYRLYSTAAMGICKSVAVAPGLVTLAKRLFRKEKYDIVHLHYPDPLSVLAASTLPHEAKFVVTWHSDIVRQKQLLRFYQPFVRQFSIRRVRALIVPTPAHYSSSEQIKLVMGPLQPTVVPFGFDAAGFSRQIRPEVVGRLRKLSGGRVVVFALGRLIYYKGFEYLIRAAAKLVNATLVIGGDGPLRQHLERLSQSLSLTDRVRFVGHLEDDDIASYFAASDVFCLSSTERTEAFGLVQANAMCLGKPVVCYDLQNGVTYVNQNEVTGLVARLMDVDDLAFQLQRLIDNAELRARLGTQARERILTEFTCEQMVEGTIRVYRSVLGNPTV